MKRCNAGDPYVNGTWPAFWMLGGNSGEQGYGGSVAWPDCGEIDIIEWIGTYDATHYQTNQWGSPAFPVDHNSPSTVNYSIGPERWHTYGVRFNGDTITFTFDGQDVSTKSYNDADDHTHRILLNMALGGDMAGTIAGDFSSDELQIDWVRVKDASGNVLWSDEMDDENTTKSKWFPFIGFAYNNEEQYYTDWETDNFSRHDDSTLGECN
jgi:beta-glucanase (GH16 family)